MRGNQVLHLGEGGEDGVEVRNSRHGHRQSHRTCKSSSYGRERIRQEGKQDNLACIIGCMAFMSEHRRETRLCVIK